MLGLLRTSPCPGQSNGLIESQVLGGYQPYAYAWSNGQAQADLNGIPWGTYGLTVTDQMGCTVSAGATLWPALITLNGSVRNACSLLPDGQIELTLGAGPFSLQWSTGATGAHLNGLSPGQYCVTATNTNGCSGSACFQVGEDPPATAYRPSDCRYLDRYCHGQYVGSQFAGIAQTYVDHYYCTYNEACFNGQIYAQVQGFGGSGFFGGYQNGAPYCRYQEWCSFPDGTVVLGAGWPASVYSEIINVGYLECPSGMAWADYCDGTFMGIRCLNIAGPAERIAGEHPQPVADSLFMDLRIPTNGLDAHAAVSAALAETLGTAATGAEDRPSALDAPWWRIENNPFAQNIPLTAFSPRSRAATLRLTNALGQSVLEHRTTLAAGENRFALEVPGELPDGFYLLEMALDGRALPPIKCLRHRP
jgi:hypothetical protein